MAYADMVASKTMRELIAIKRNLELAADEVGCFTGDDPDLLEAVEAELGKRKGQTTKDYWDCQCEGFHLRSKDQDKCPGCGARREDSPDSLAVKVEEEIQGLSRAIQCLKEDDVYAMLDNGLSPEIKARLGWPPRA